MSQESFLCSSFNPFYSLKCVQGAAENELAPVPCLMFLSMAITGAPWRRRERLQQTEVRLLAALCEIIVSPLDPLCFLLLSLIWLVFSRLARACLCFVLYLLLSLLHAYHPTLTPSPLPFSAILPYSQLSSTPLLLFCFISSATEVLQCTENGK